MLARCAVCAHSQRAILDARLLAGEALMPLAYEYGLRSRDLRHHRDAHVLGKPLGTPTSAPLRRV